MRVKNRILNFQHLKNVILVKDQDLNLELVQVHAQCVEVMVKYDQARVFLLYNKHVHNAQDQVNK